MNIQFQQIKFKNIMSYQNEFSSLDFSEGIDLILGRNGSGKSTIADSLFYVLFGRPYRKVKTSSLINRITKKGLLVELNLKVNNKQYKIIRGQKPNRFEIFLDDTLIEQRAATKDYQKMLEEEILTLNETIFRQLIILGANQSNSKPFMELSAQEKESLFQVITDTSIFGHLKNAIKVRTQDKKVQIKDLEYKKELLKSSLESEESMIKQAEKQNEDFQKHHQDNISSTKTNISKTEETIEKYKSALVKLKELREKYTFLDQEINIKTEELNLLRTKNTELISNQQELNMVKYRDLISKCSISEEEIKEIQLRENFILELKQKNQLLSAKKRELESKISIIESAEQSSISCVDCSSINYLTDISKEEVQNKESYKKDIKDIMQEITSCTNEIKSKEQELRVYKNTIDSTTEANKRNIQLQKDSLQEELSKKEQELSNEVKPLEEQIRSSTKTKDLYKEKLLNGKRIKETLQEQKKNLEFYNNELIKLNSIKAIEINYDSLIKKKEDSSLVHTALQKELKIKDDLLYLGTIIDGNNLKGAVIKKQIPFLNKGINHFLELFSMLDYSFVIDENFKERLISREDDSEFNSLSNGQKARISFSIMFAFLKLIEERNGVKTNILLLDEILDSSVDASGRDELLQILKSEFSETKDIIIISHNDQIKEKVEMFDRLIHITKDKSSALRVEDL